MMRFMISVLLMLHILGAHAEEGDLLEPEQAFKFSARVLDANNIEVRYQIANGYYLYREKIKFSADAAGVTLGAGQFPAGKIKQDEYFGKVETYRNNIIIKLPLSRSGRAEQGFTLKAVSQGCADAGVCYPPLTQTAQLTLPASAPAEPPKASGGGLAALTALVRGNAQDEFLEPDQAFRLVHILRR